MNKVKKPNPGSDEAIEKGCTCPVIDNSYGKGYLGSDVFVVRMDCPLHNEIIKKEGGNLPPPYQIKL
jgi:hypothetical protein